MYLVNFTYSSLQNFATDVASEITSLDFLILGVGLSAILLLNQDKIKSKFRDYIKYRKLCSTVEKIDKLIIEGKDVCLFIGRTPKEKLPSELEEAKANEVWVSCDINDEGLTENPIIGLSSFPSRKSISSF